MTLKERKETVIKTQSYMFSWFKKAELGSKKQNKYLQFSSENKRNKYLNAEKLRYQII